MRGCKVGRINGDRLLELPLHLIFDILSMLTIETVFSCKCVCKTFLQILKDPYFVELHLKKAPNGLIITSNVYDIFLVYGNRPGFYDSLSCQTLPMPISIHKHVRIIASCNGLLCTLVYYTHRLTNYNFYISNPILGECVALPSHFPNLLVRDVGFGFCPKTKQYKVLRFVTPSICSIYTLGTGCWRQIIGEVPPYPATIASFDSSFNGNLHWITNSTKVSNFICSFNLETEHFSYMSPPRALFFGDSSPLEHFDPKVLMFTVINVGLLGGLFCFSYIRGSKFESFVMKDYGSEGCWTKKYSYDLNSPSFGYWKWNMTTFLNNGNLLLSNRCNGKFALVFCDLQNGTKRYTVRKKLDTCFGFSSFVPSFISLRDIAHGNVEVVQRKMGCDNSSENGFQFIN